jgi:hypothetical protein
MSYKIKSEASKKGYRDGKDCCLLERDKNNPYEPLSVDWTEYENAWDLGWEDEENTCL